MAGFGLSRNNKIVAEVFGLFVSGEFKAITPSASLENHI
jgi:hypothetical protein